MLLPADKLVDLCWLCLPWDVVARPKWRICGGAGSTDSLLCLQYTYMD